MLKTIFAVFVTIFFSANLFSNDPNKNADSKLEVLKKQVIADILAEPANEQDVTRFVETMREDGSWADINYADKTRGGWLVHEHLTRLMDMAVMYKRTGNKWNGDAQLQAKLLAGLEYWLKNDFICPNWWYPQIGVPKVLGPIMLLVEDKITPAQTAAGVKILDRAQIGMTGQNKVWLSGNVIYRSLLTGNVNAVEAAVKAIQEEIVVSEGEGVQADFSFHQHGTQQQFGNYGSSFAGDMLKWAHIFQNTAFQFEPQKIAILRNYLLQGMRWIIWKNKMDISACGRQLFPNAQTGKAGSIARILDKMPSIDPAFSDAYKKGMGDFSGNNHFWKSDMTVHRRQNFYVSVKMSSNRVGGAESCNEENVQGYHLGDGATYFYQSNDEYTDIFPFWDWKMIPGITAIHDEVPLPVLPCSGYNIHSDFVGGVSDGMNGIATLAYRRDSLQAQKSWFFFEDAIICLGAGIHTDLDKEIRTTVNQSYLYGNVLVKQGSVVQPVQNGQHSLSNVSWVLHDNWGYFFPGKQNVELASRNQTGDWHGVLRRMPAAEIKADMFTLWFNHQAQPKAASYAYYVFPGANADNIDARASDFTVVKNSEQLQEAEWAKKQLAGLVFVQAGEATTKTFGKISADKPCTILLTKKAAIIEAVISDPTHLQTEINLVFSGDKKSKTVAGVYDRLTNTTSFKITLPVGPEAGKSFQFIVE